jgi:hypothetical protein
MRSRPLHRMTSGISLVVAILMALLTGVTAVSAASWQRCPDVEYWQSVQVKGVSCATAVKVRDRAMRKIPGGLPINWNGRVGSWTCSYVNAQGPGGLKCMKGAKQIRYDHGA